MSRTLINITDLMGEDWRFLAPYMLNADLNWQTYASQAQTGHPRMRRFKACWAAARAAKKAHKNGERPILISHLPNMSALTNLARRLICPKVPHIAFSFNFTTMPVGLRKVGFQQALKGIDEFVIFSNYERDRYVNCFGIPAPKFHFMTWAMEPPPVARPSEPASDVPYVCAIGGEARDYQLMAEAMRCLPERHAKIVARAYSISGIDFPDNVDVALNLPLEQTWRLGVDSIGMVLPLVSREATCGHITFVAAQLLGLPLLATRCDGLTDYAHEDWVAGMVEPGDLQSLKVGIEALFAERSKAQRIADDAQMMAKNRYHLSAWTSYIETVLERF